MVRSTIMLFVIIYIKTCFWKPTMKDKVSYLVGDICNRVKLCSKIWDFNKVSGAPNILPDQDKAPSYVFIMFATSPAPMMEVATMVGGRPLATRPLLYNP